MTDICVIGAGIAGLSAARELTRNGREVMVLDKSRGVGGRAATRRISGNRVDHGAQHFTVRDDRFRQLVEIWLEAGHVAEWTRGFHRLNGDGQLEEPSGEHPRYVCPDGMNTLGKLLASGLDTRPNSRALGVMPDPAGWRIELSGGDTVTARQLLICTPAAQALALLDEVSIAPAVGAALAAVGFDPCWAVMAGYQRDIAPNWLGVRLESNPVVAWAAHDSSKRSDPPQTVLVLHSTPEFAREHDRSAAPLAVRRMLEAAAVLGDWIAEPLWSDHQRWRYSLASAAHPEPYLEAAAGLYLGGDWCGGARIEAAYLSGVAAAAALERHRSGGSPD